VPVVPPTSPVVPPDVPVLDPPVLEAAALPVLAPAVVPAALELAEVRPAVDDPLELLPPSPTPEIAVELEQLQEAWRRTILPAVEARSIPIGKTLAEAHPASLTGDTLTLEFPQTASFHLKLAEDPKNAAMLRDALYEVTGRKLAIAFELGETEHAEVEDDAPASEEDVLELMKSTFDAREVDE